MRLSLLLMAGLLVSANLIAQSFNGDGPSSPSGPTNVQNEVGVKNTQLVFFGHFLDDVDPNLTAKKFFKRYLYYYPQNSIAPSDYLMDSFLFSDLGFKDKKKGWFGEYKFDELSNYIDNFFIRTKLPLTRYLGANQVGRMRASEYAELSIRFDNFKVGKEYEVEFQAKLQSNQPTVITNFTYGVQYFDEGIPVVPNSTICGSSFPNTLWESCRGGVETLDNDWMTIKFKFTVPNFTGSSDGNDYIKIHIVNMTPQNRPDNGIPNDDDDYDLYVKEIYIDNFTISDCTVPGSPCNDNNLINYATDGTFNINKNATNWEYEHRLGGNSRRHLFEDKKPLLDELWDAKNSVTIPSDETKLILALPEIQCTYNSVIQNWESIYTDTNRANELRTIITDYINEIETRFNNWKDMPSNKGATIKIAGLYYLGEDFRSDGRIAIVKPFLEYARDELHKKGWQLFASPFLPKDGLHGDSNDEYLCNIQSSYKDDLIENVFDMSWQQPGAFYNAGCKFPDFTPNVDRDFLEEATLELMRPKKMGANIESRPLNYVTDTCPRAPEEYGRVRDYFDYGYKFGYSNYSKLYYDNNGAHYSNSYSSDPLKRIDYDDLYEFIRKGRKGVLPNKNFENHERNYILYNWVGTFNRELTTFSTSENRFLQFNTNLNVNRYDSEVFPVTDDDKIYLTFRAKEIEDDYKAYSGLVGVNFYDNNGNEITNMNTSYPNSNITGYSNYLDAFYLGIDTSEVFQDFEVYFTPPSTAVSMKFFLYRYRTASVLWKDVKVHRVSKQNEPEIFYTYPTQPILQKENKIKNGTAHIKLSQNQYAESFEKISIDPSKPYSFSIDVKEELPILNFTKNNKALIGVIAYDKDGVQLNNSSAVTGMTCCSSLNNMYFKYIPFVDQVWKKFTTGPITFSSDVASIRIQIHNWYYNNTILVDNLEFEYYQDDYNELVFPIDNLLKKSSWNEAFPISVVQHEPAYYNELIDVNGKGSLKFSAMFRDKDIESSTGDRLLAIELLDENFNLLTDDDGINSSNSNLSYSSFYKYWWTDYLDVLSFDCVNGNLLKKSFWRRLEQDFTFPNQVKWVRLSVHHLNSNGELRMLNPILTENIGRPVAGKQNENANILSTESLNSKESIRIHPNPTKNTIAVSFLDDNEMKSTYTLYNISGQIVGEGYLNSKSNQVSLENVASGMYFINIQNENHNSTHKILKE